MNVRVGRAPTGRLYASRRSALLTKPPGVFAHSGDDPSRGRRPSSALRSTCDRARFRMQEHPPTGASLRALRVARRSRRFPDAEGVLLAGTLGRTGIAIRDTISISSSSYDQTSGGAPSPISSTLASSTNRGHPPGSRPSARAVFRRADRSWAPRMLSQAPRRQISSQ